MAEVRTNPANRRRLADGWRRRRIYIAGALGALLAGSRWLLDFWPLGAGGSVGNAIRALFDLSRIFFTLALAGFALGLLIAAGIALWRRQLRRAVSSILAIAAMPICFLAVAKTPLFDPWLWYAMVNRTRFEALAVSDPSPNGPKYAVVEGRDVSVGFSGIDPNHFVFLVYDESDAVGLEPSDRPSFWHTRTLYPNFDPIPPVPRGRRLFGHFFRVDDFE